MSDKDQILMDRLMREYFGDRYPGATPRPELRAVTAENAHEFAPAPRKRGRPRCIDARDNVVPIGSRRSAAAVPVTTGNGPHDALSAEVDRRMSKFVDWLEADSAKKARARAERSAAQSGESTPLRPDVDQWLREIMQRKLARTIGRGDAPPEPRAPHTTK